MRQVDAGLGLTRTLAECFRDGHDQRFVEHSLPQLPGQRLHALAPGYEDLNDHDQLRRDAVFATACGKPDPLGQDRSAPADRGCPRSSAATLNRLTLGARCLPKHTDEVVLDVDSMGHRLHGLQQGRYYNDFYGEDCYLLLYLVVGDMVLWAQLRTSDKGGAEGVVPALTQVVAALRQRCKKARIILRGDGGSCTEEIMAWCAAQPDVTTASGSRKTPC